MDEQKQQPPDDETNEPRVRGRPVTREAVQWILEEACRGGPPASGVRAGDPT